MLQPLLGRPPGLAVVLIGNRPDSSLYVSKKAEACAQAGTVKCGGILEHQSFGGLWHNLLLHAMKCNKCGGIMLCYVCCV
jgi:methylenetetrahydrofolate dehydrogenase (NADP+)/methenyltetrahydrofolate cyclohydrolase